MKRIEAASPTRVDLAGGTLDLWPLYIFHKECVTVNLAIDIRTYVTIVPRSDKKIILASQDTKMEQEYGSVEEVSVEVEGRGNHDLHLLKVHIDFWKPRAGFELHTKSESPVGAGIAASSSLNISLCGAFSTLVGRKLSTEETVTLAGNLEARVIQTPTGCQDYFPALFGGLNIIELTPLGPKRSALEMDLDEFARHFILIYTGRPHHSGLNNWQIFKDHIDGHDGTYKNFEKLKFVATGMHQACQSKEWGNFGKLFDDEFLARTGLSKVFTSPEIERLRKIGIQAGAEALKILWCRGRGVRVFVDARRKTRRGGERMSASRVSGASSQTHSSRSRDQNSLRPHRFIGVDLSGGKNDRTSLAVLDYYPGQKKLFLTHIYEHIQQEDGISADQALFEIILEHSQNLEYLCIDAPLKFPKCIRCKLACPGYERCKEKEIQWMWKQHRKQKRSKPRSKLFTPYTQRAAEIYLSTELDEPIYPNETLGANIAPLTARAHFLVRRLPAKIKTIEVLPKLSLLRIGNSLKISKSHLNHYKHQVGGDESRQTILQGFVKRDLIFIYQQDFLKLIENCNSFDAFIAAYTGFLKYHDQCEVPPKDFPRADGWIDFPIKDIEF